MGRKFGQNEEKVEGVGESDEKVGRRRREPKDPPPDWQNASPQFPTKARRFPKASHEGSKIVPGASPRPSRDPFGHHIPFRSLFVAFCVPSWTPKTPPETSQRGPGRGQERPKSLPRTFYETPYFEIYFSIAFLFDFGVIWGWVLILKRSQKHIKNGP